VALTINKHRCWLWRAVDQDGTVLDILVQSRRDQHAAERFLHRVLDAEDGVEPQVIITDKLARYVPAIKRAIHTRITVGTSASTTEPRTRIAGAQAGEGDAALQVTGAGAAIPGDVQRGVQPLPSAAAPPLS
jgi:hypothetical protein